MVIVSSWSLFSDPAAHPKQPSTTKKAQSVIDSVSSTIVEPKSQSAEWSLARAKQLFEVLDPTFSDPDLELSVGESQEQTLITWMLSMLDYSWYVLNKADQAKIRSEYNAAPWNREQKLAIIRNYISQNAAKSWIVKKDQEHVPVLLSAIKERDVAIKKLNNSTNIEDWLLQTALATNGKMWFLGFGLFAKTNRRLRRAKRIFDINNPTKEWAVKLLNVLYRKSMCKVFARPFSWGIIAKNWWNKLQRDLDATVNAILEHINNLWENKQISKWAKFLLIQQVKKAYEIVDTEYRKSSEPNFEKQINKIKF